jgi:hypothetical protein
MTLTLMKCLPPTFSMTRVATAIVGSVILTAPGAWAGAAASPASPLPDDVAGRSVSPGHHSTFCQIPPRPSGVRTGKDFKQAVVAIRLAGVRLAAQSAPGTFSLEDTDGFASAARAQAAPPPPITSPDDQQTDIFINQARALARPPGPR